ncbi:MAG: hypothetical protein KAX38_04945 [Candidatus Krumholzibacteria bacterium]|nr:hypothetical protein [Candidatus Krumholzibacteria bacterium]
MSAKKLTRKQIKEDTFITTTVKTLEYLKKHQTLLFVGLLVVIVIIAGTGWISRSRKQTQAAASAQFSDALVSFRKGDLATAEEIFKLISERYRGVREGVYAIYFAGNCALESGRNTDAIESFDRYLEAGDRYPFFHDAAMDGKGTALENEERYGDAAKVYLELLKDIKTNSFMEKIYLRRAADNLKLSNQNKRAIEIIQQLLEKSTGMDRRDIEIELDLLRG